MSHFRWFPTWLMIGGLGAFACDETPPTGLEILSAPPSVRVASVVVTPEAATLTSFGSSVTLVARAYDSTRGPLTGLTTRWVSLDTAIARVNHTGNVSPAGVGTTEVQAIVEGVTGSARVTVSIACPDSSASKSVLIDASLDGGVWWYPQSGPFDPAQEHQGKALADYLRVRGFTVTELGRERWLSDHLALTHAVVIRVGSYGPYLSLAPYRNFLSCATTLILLNDHQRFGAGDPVARLLGIEFEGAYDGDLSRFAAHQITTGVTRMPYLVGSGMIVHDAARVRLLGWLSDGRPVMGVIDRAPSKVFFLGDVNLLETVPQPLVDNLIAWGF
jgi:hypothetical protein